jgi:hypothetical protein
MDGRFGWSGWRPFDEKNITGKKIIIIMNSLQQPETTNQWSTHTQISKDVVSMVPS